MTIHIQIIVCIMQHSDLPPAADEVEPVYSAPHRHVAAEPTEVSHLYH